MAVGLCPRPVVVASPSLSTCRRFLSLLRGLNLRVSSSSLPFFRSKRRVVLLHAGEELPLGDLRVSLRSSRRRSREREFNAFGAPAVWKKRRSTRAYSSGESARTESRLDVEVSALTLYEMLGISQQVGLPEIKTAYRQMARRYHPDANPPSKRDECTEKFLRVQEAYEVLTDPALRADYDFRLRNPLSVQALTSGIAYKSHEGKSGRGWRRSVSKEVDKDTWRAQWEAQVDGLRMGARREKEGSWAARMRQKREEGAASQ